MGLKSEWMRLVEVALIAEDIEVQQLNHEYFYLLSCLDRTLIINLIPIDNHFLPLQLVEFQELSQHSNIQVINLWEDVFKSKNKQVISRIRSIVGYNQKIHGRKTKIVKISSADANLFLSRYHLQGSVGARHRYGLSYENELVAVATFSNKRRMMRKSADYTSAELIRFATKDGSTVIGGMTKLIRHFAKEVAPNDIMSYADRDWSLGKGYLSSGFKLLTETPPAKLLLDLQTMERRFPHRVPQVEQAADSGSFKEIFNTGNLKYVLEF